MPRSRRRGPRAGLHTSEKATMEPRDAFDQRVQRRMSQYGLSASEAFLQQVCADLMEEDEKERENELERQHALRLAELRGTISQPDATHTTPLFEAHSPSGASFKAPTFPSNLPCLMSTPAEAREEFERRLQEMRDLHQESAAGHSELGWDDEIRRQLWYEALTYERCHPLKDIPSASDVYWAQYQAREGLLEGRPREEWEKELQRLVQAESTLDDSYRALRWFTAQLRPSTADGSPTEGVGYGGPGLLLPRMHGDSDFGSDTEWRREWILDLRCEALDFEGDEWDMEELEFLVEKEWELEKAYKRLLDRAPQLGLSPIAWDCPAGSADSHEDREETDEMEPEVLLRLPDMTAAEEAASLQRAWQMLSSQEGPSEGSKWPGEEANLPQEDASPVFIAPAAVLAPGQSAVGLCPSPDARAESPEEDLRGLFPQQPMPPPGASKPLLPQENVFPVYFNPVPAPPAEALAAGQSTTNLSPPPIEWCPEDPGADLQGPIPSLQGDISPAKELATGQSAAGLCPPSPLYPESPEGDPCGLFSPQPIPQPQVDLYPVTCSPAEELATGQNAAGLCPFTTLVPADPGEDPHGLHSQQPIALPRLEDASLPSPTPIHPAEALAMGQSAIGLCPPPDLCPDDPGKVCQGPLPSPPEEMAPVPVHPAEELATGQSAAGLCPPLLLCPEDPSEDPQGLLPQLPTALPGATDALLLFPQVDINPVPAHPAEELAAGQSAAGLCPPTLFYPTDPGKDHPGLHAQQPTALLRMEDAILPSPHGDTFPTPVHPAEELAPGQSAAGLCPPTAPTPEDPGEDPHRLPHPQPLIPPSLGDAVFPSPPDDTFPVSRAPAEELATGQSAAGLCPHPDLCPDDPGKDRQGPLPSPHDNPTPMHRSPAEALAPGQSIASLCPYPRSLVLEVLGTLLPWVIDTPVSHLPADAPAPGQSLVSLCPPPRPLVLEVSGTVGPRVIDTPGEGTGGTSPHQPDTSPAGGTGTPLHPQQARHQSQVHPSDRGLTPRSKRRSPGARLLPTDYGPRRLLLRHPESTRLGPTVAVGLLWGGRYVTEPA